MVARGGPARESTILFCTDRSAVGVRALAAGLEMLRTVERPVIATVVEEVDPTLVVGTGFAAGVATPQEAETMRSERLLEADRSLSEVQSDLGLVDAEKMVIESDAPGVALCELAASLEAGAMVIGTHGHGGVRRTVLGSVSDHIVRHAPCTVVVTAVE